MNGKSKLWAITLLVGVLIVGGLVGATADRLIFRDGPRVEKERERRDSDDRDRRERYLDWLSGELELTDGQRAEVAAIVDRYRERTSQIWKEVRPRFEAVKSDLRAEIRDVLTEQQRAGYERLLAEHDRDRRYGDKEDRKD